jgi:hypothetical protein
VNPPTDQENTQRKLKNIHHKSPVAKQDTKKQRNKPTKQTRNPTNNQTIKQTLSKQTNKEANWHVEVDLLLSMQNKNIVPTPSNRNVRRKSHISKNERNLANQQLERMP